MPNNSQLLHIDLCDQIGHRMQLPGDLRPRNAGEKYNPRRGYWYTNLNPVVPSSVDHMKPVDSCRAGIQNCMKSAEHWSSSLCVCVCACVVEGESEEANLYQVYTYRSWHLAAVDSSIAAPSSSEKCTQQMLAWIL